MDGIDNERAAPYIRLHPDESPMMNHQLSPLHGSSSSAHLVAPTATPSEHYVRKRNITKYSSALRSLIPFRWKITETTVLPLDDRGYFSLLTFSWIISFLRNSPSNITLTTSKLDSSNLNGQRLKDFLRDENVKRGQLNGRMICVAWRFFKTRIVVASLIYILSSAMYIIGLIFFLTWFLQTGEILNLLVLMMTFSFSLLLHCWSDSMTFRTANRLQSAFMSVMYKHLLRVSILHSVSAQRIVTTMVADSQRVHEAVMCLPLVLAAPLVLLLPVPMLIMKMDCYTWEDSVFVVLVCLLIVPVVYLLARLNNVWKSRMSIFTSKRLTSLQELLLHVPLVKMTLKEKLFHRNAEDLRKNECLYMKKVNLCNGFTVSFLHTMPLVLIVLLWHQSDILRARMEFIKCKDANLISIIILLLIPFKELLFNFWLGVLKILDGLMAFKRLKRVLVLECVTKATSRKPINHLIAFSATEATYIIKVSNAREAVARSSKCACWWCTNHESEELEMQSKIVLQDINFAAPKGKVIGVCGDTCSGKTALILAILGQINSQYGSDKLLRDGSYAYVGQNPWVMDATLRENILFNESFIHKRYYHVIHCCSLNDDIGQLPGGDQTLISDATLTLGQKQRIALARALYANRDIYLLDDLLSAVSSEVGTIIFERAIQKHLKDKTVIITSRQVKYLKLCDEIFVLKEGKIVEQGSHESLMEMETYPFLFHSYLQEESNTTENEKSHSANVRSNATQSGINILSPVNNIVNMPDSVEDDGEQESVNMNVRYNNSVSFFKTLALETESSVPVLISLIFRIIYVLSIMISPILILKYLKLDSTRYFVALGFFFIILLTRTVGIISYDQVTYKISLQVHFTWIENICKGCLNVFQSASHAEILRWFSLHLSEIDTYLPSNSILWVENLFLLFLLFIVLSICSCWFLIPIIIVCVSCHFLLRFTNSALMKFYDQAEAACLCLNGYVSSTIMGRVTIQAFTKEQDYWSTFHSQCDKFLAYSQLQQAAALWLRFWTQIISLIFIVIVVGSLCMNKEMKNWLFILHPEEDYHTLTTITIFCVFLVGYILNNIMQLSASMSSKFRVLGNLDATVRSIKPEDEHSVPYITSNPFLNGSLSFRDVKLEFWPDAQPSWRGISFQILSGEKIGILGLPGSGKTAIISALYKVARLSQGSISIGEVDIKTATVEYLRSCIALVPKNPLMFSGTIRLNVDPMHRYSVRELCESLEKVGMLEIIENMPNHLDTQVRNIDNMLTVQECQLLYVAQAMLRHPKVLILEEPIESADAKDMFKVQDVVEQLFHCTTLVVAQNMKYVSKCDRIIVMKDGQVVEFDTPENLIRNSNYYFSQMQTVSADSLETEV